MNIVTSPQSLIRANQGPQTAPAKDSPANPSAGEQKDTVTIQLLQTTDMHGTAVPLKESVEVNGETQKVDFGGAAHLAALIDDKRDDVERTLVVDSGDPVSGQVVTDADQGFSMVNLMNKMGYDVAIPGNHDFDFGTDSFRERLSKTEFPVLTSNLTNADGSQVENTSPTMLFDLQGVTVGVIGLMTEQLPSLVRESYREGFIVGDPEQKLAEELPKLRDAGAELVVVLTHQDDAEDEALAAAFPNEGLILLGGHSHVPQDEVKTISGNYLFKAGALTTRLGQVLVEFDPETDKVVSIDGNLLPVRNDSIKPDAEIAKLVDGYQTKTQKVMGGVVGNLKEALTRDASRDSNLGNMVTDAMRYAYDAEVAFMNTDGIRTDLEKGEVTKGNLHEVHPFQGAEVVPGVLTGDMILRALQHSIKHREDDGKSHFLQVSGVSFSYGHQGVKNVMIGGEPLDLDREYRAAVGTYLGEGGLGYTMFTEGKFESTGTGLREALIDYATKVGYDNIDPAGTRINDETRLAA